jgi:hypothetical protein
MVKILRIGVNWMIKKEKEEIENKNILLLRQKSASGRCLSPTRALSAARLEGLDA